MEVKPLNKWATISTRVFEMLLGWEGRIFQLEWEGNTLFLTQLCFNYENAAGMGLENDPWTVL